jgi:hypothetical protein
LGYASHAANLSTIAQNDYQTAIGRWNIATDPAKDQTQQDDAFIIGNGYNGVRSNAFRVTYQGNVYSATGSYTAGADYAEMFEWLDGNTQSEDRRGFFVTLQGKHIRIAAQQDDYILGVVSATPSLVGDSQGMSWHDMYLRDEFGEIIYELKEAEVRPITNKDEANTDHKEKVYRQRPKLNPVYDPSKPYLSRDQREEWAAIGIVGKLIVRDDGSCKPNGFCRVAEGGIATASENGYRVLERISNDKVRIMLK